MFSSIVSSRRRLWLLLLLASAAAALLVVGLQPSRLNDYILRHRLVMVSTMAVVAVASALATLVFQTLTNNRILSPSMMGFESLFVLIQTSLMFFLPLVHVAALPPLLLFFLQVALMMTLTTLLYRKILFGRAAQDLYLLVLTGIVCGALFGGGAMLLQRLLSPEDFAILQGRLFARFSLADPDLLMVSALITLLTSVWLWRRRHLLDVLALGRATALLLGVDWSREVYRLLAVISLLVAMATALIGPLSFFGFLAVTLCYQCLPSRYHQVMMPAAVLIGFAILCSGQLILQYLLGMSGSLSVVMELIGGSLFLFTLLARKTS